MHVKDDIQIEMSNKVDQILTLKKENPHADTSVLERKIDLMVYALYGLTYDEVLTVEPEFGERMNYEAYEELQEE